MAREPQVSLRPICILNSKSVHVQSAMGHIARISGAFGAEAQVVVTKRGDDVSSLAARALNDRRRPVVAGGGDGTVNAVAGQLAGTETPLGVLPMEALNHFAKDVGVPLELEQAVQNIFIGHIRKVDVGRGQREGLRQQFGYRLLPAFRAPSGRTGASRARQACCCPARVEAMLRRYFRLRIRLHMKHAAALERLTPFLFVGNNPYQTSGLEIGRRLRIDSGRLWVCTAPKAGREKIWRPTLRTLMGRPTDQELNAFEAEEIWVEPGSPRINVSTDGEVSVMDAPLHYRIRARALGVVVPV